MSEVTKMDLTAKINAEFMEATQPKYCFRVYSKNANTTWHIFACKRQKGEIQISQRPCCNADEVNAQNVQQSYKGNIHDCMTPDEIRQKCSELKKKGINICANCVKTFYHNEDD